MFHLYCHSYLRFLVTGIFSIFGCEVAYSQVIDTDIEINETTTTGEANLDIPDGKIELLRLTVYDADFPDEGNLFINDQGPIGLFPGGDSTLDGLSVDIDILLSEEQKSWFIAGINTFRFVHVSTAGFTIERIASIGEIAIKTYDSVTPDMTSNDVSPNRTIALNIYKRLVGVTTSIDNPLLMEMEAAIDSGDLNAAAQMASDQPGFLNNVVRDMAAKMSTRDETVKSELNDFVSTFIGAVRDELDARTLLTGNYFYKASDQTPVPNNMEEDLLKSNSHYSTLENDRYDLASVLVRVNNQVTRAPGGGVVSHPDPAGLLTSRGFMMAHASAGTNRRLVEYMMREFTCNPMENWSDTTSPDLLVGRDVERFPGGDGAKFQTTCKACHANMDGMRGAFARFDFSDGFVKYASLYPDGNGEDSLQQTPIGVSSKLNQNTDVFPQGFQTTNDSWQNFARSPANQTLFGWRGTVSSGAGIGQLATAVSNTTAFSSCMVKRTFRELCGREPASFESQFVDLMSQQFESSNYNLKKLFQTISIQNECLGK